jgi:hypothetical protein
LFAACVPERVADGARYLVDYWNQWAQTNEFRESAMAKWEKMDQELTVVFNTPELRPDDVNRCISKSIPEAFEGFPIWNVKSMRIAGRDISPSDLFEDQLTCLLAWCGVVGIHKGNIVPGYLPNPRGEYLYGGMLGSLTNIGHLQT